MLYDRTTTSWLRIKSSKATVVCARKMQPAMTSLQLRLRGDG
jgi:hypothetical protein